MPRDGAIIFGDLIGKLDVAARELYQVRARWLLRSIRLINQRGRNAKLIDWLDELTAECPKKIAHTVNDPCGARCTQLPKVL